MQAKEQLLEQYNVLKKGQDQQLKTSLALSYQQNMDASQQRRQNEQLVERMED